MATFKVRDLMINVIYPRLKIKNFGTALCTQDQPTQLNCGLASPIMRSVKLAGLVEHGVEVVGRAARSGDLESLNAAMEIADEAGQLMVAGAMQDSGVFQPDPNCNGTSLETIPSPLTPVASKASIIDVADLPLIKERVQQTLATIDKIEAQFAPSAGLETEVVTEHLKGALDSLQ
jgi:hypothetical protein